MNSAPVAIKTTDVVAKDERTGADSCRTDATRSLLKQADAVLAKWNDLKHLGVMEAGALQRTKDALLRARREFEAKLFFVVVFGPLKAGKSTLANALAREHVSPTGFGVETTLRPSIIVQGNEAGIDQYFRRDPDGAVEQSDFDRVADFLRGLIGDEELDHFVERVSGPLNQGTVETKLARDVGRKPLITVLRVPGGNMINGRVAVVDMPGLDGERSNWGKDPIHEWVIQRADFFIFVQSSVAALNHETREFLQEVVKKSKKPPMWVVQNIIDAKHWLEPSQREREASDQKRKALERVVELLSIPANQVPNSTGMNLGKAWDGIFQGRPEWVINSGFGEFENEITRLLHAQQAVIQERNSVRGFGKAREDSLRNLEEIEGRIKGFLESHRRFLGVLSDCQNEVARINYSTAGRTGLVAGFGHAANAARDEWKKHLEAEEARLTHEFNRELTGKELNQAMETFSQDIADHGRRRCFAGTVFLEACRIVAAQHCSAAEHCSLDDSQASVHKANKLLSDHQLPMLSKPLPPVSDDFSGMVGTPLRTEAVKEHRILNRFWAITHNAEKVRDTLKRHAELFEAQIEERTNAWAASAVDRYLNHYCEQRRQFFREKLEQQEQDYQEKMRRDVTAANEALQLIKIMKAGLFELSSPIQAAISSMQAD